VLTLLWGMASERPLALVRAALEQLGAPVVLVNQHDVLESAAYLSVGSEVTGWLRTPAQEIDLEDVTAVYVRAYDATSVPAVAAAGRGSREWRHATNLDDLLWAWVEVTPALVVNRASAMLANGSKPFQLEQVRAAGFLAPSTLVTTDPDAARAFWEQHGEVIYKSVGGVRSIVSRLGPGHAERLADVATCPPQFQEFVAGTEHRVHVVGDEVFACRILTHAIDYRYRGEHTVDVQPCELPRDVADRCRAMAADMRLPVAGVDLRRTPADDWYCFEVNPSPGFDFFQARAGQPIAEAIARLLVDGAYSAPSAGALARPGHA